MIEQAERAGTDPRVGADVRAAATAWEELFRAQVAIMRRLQRDPIWDRISLREYDVLFTLSTAPDGLRLRDLGESSLLSQPSLSRMVERLEDSGWVRRAPAPEDGRGVVVALTDAGAALQREVGRRHVQAIAHYVGGALPAEDLAELTRVAGALRGAQAGIADLDRGTPPAPAAR
ncbi:MarR family transcriptional regulator [Cellulomonas sp. ES6]|uniref:MarR family winged helix-turn-helix transcriptional regulator n=1 Tax=Cellulomonas sp. ES6 TaxID=3039384 RepID=UPI0024B86C56|nr:MarR family transcriptional regulator [Cellulomonas sp. ES6]WHP17153.1 MarR family transcriptional regulator [Cellulomonas sp. ES6]